MKSEHPPPECTADELDDNLELLEEITAGHAKDSNMEALMDIDEEILTSQPKCQEAPHPKGFATSSCFDEDLHGLHLRSGGKEDIVAEVLHGVSSQFAKLEQVLGSLITKYMEPICRVSAQVAELRKENARFRAQLSIESDVAELRLENEQLRAYMASVGISPASSKTAGTGESSSSRTEAVMMPSGGTTGGSEILIDKSGALPLARQVSAGSSSSGATGGSEVRRPVQSHHVVPPTPVSPVISLPQGSAPELGNESWDELQRAVATRGNPEEATNHPMVVQYGSENAALDRLGSADGTRGVTGVVPMMDITKTLSSCSLVPPQATEKKKVKSTRFSTASSPGIHVSPIPSMRISAMSGTSDYSAVVGTMSFASSLPQDNLDARMKRFSEREDLKHGIERHMSVASRMSRKSKAHQRMSLMQRPSVAAQAINFMRGNAVRFSVSDATDSEEAMVRHKGMPQEKMFADVNEMKEKLREAIGKPKYDVANFYYETGCCQRIARASWFENFTLFVIALNAIWIAVDTEYNDKDVLIEADPAFQIAENLFCIYFTMEWIIRFLSFADKTNCFRDGWFVFDSSLVLMMVSETWILSLVLLLSNNSSGGFGDASIVRLVKLLRLTRMARMAKLLVAMPELNILLKGISCAGRSVFFTLLLLAVILYIFGIAFTQMLIDTPVGNRYFGNLATSMMTLLLHGTLLEDLPRVVRAVGNESFIYGAVLLIFVLLASLTVMNMLIGILCEVVSVVSAVEKENCLLQFVKSRMQEMLNESGLDADGDGMITKSEFEKLIEIPEAARALQEVGVDVLGLVDSAD